MHALSRDFTGEGLQWTRAIFGDVSSHGTHTAGTIAAADNGLGTIGVAPEAELVLVKVLFDEGWGSFGDILAGMLYATDVDAQIVSMSLGGEFPRYEATGAASREITIVSRVAMYARQRGTTVIAAVGNSALDLDRGPMINLPSDAPNVIGVSATSPRGWGQDPTTSLDVPTTYTNYGRTAVDLAGPGGDIDPNADFGATCTVGVVEGVPCFVFDLVLSTGAADLEGNMYWFWSGGTSMATPHVAGIAALILGEGNVSTPAQLEQALRTRATDLGQPGNDAFYGHGRASSGY